MKLTFALQVRDMNTNDTWHVVKSHRFSQPIIENLMQNKHYVGFFFSSSSSSWEKALRSKGGESITKEKCLYSSLRCVNCDALGMIRKTFY